MRTSFPLLPRPYRAPGGLFIWSIAGQTPSCPAPPRASTTAGAVIVLLSIANIVTAMAPRLLQPRDDSAQPDADEADTLFQASVFGGVLLAGLVFDAGHTLWRRSSSSGQPARFTRRHANLTPGLIHRRCRVRRVAVSAAQRRHTQRRRCSQPRARRWRGGRAGGVKIKRAGG